MNKRDTDLLDMLPALEDGSLKYTPISICRDMVNLIPDDVFNKDAKFLDIACKSGRFLREIMYRLMESNQMQSGSAEGRDKKKYNLAIESERKEYIMREQLFGLSLNDTVVNIARRNLYGTLDSGIENIITVKEYPEISHKPEYVMGDTNIYKILKEKFNIMADAKGMFDVVIGNPPYNSGMDLDFVDLGYKLSKKYVCMITPAKWKTADETQRIASAMSYGEFRQSYEPHMKYICFYPDCKDVFNIMQADGISWYLIDKLHIYDKCTIVNKLNANKVIDSVSERNLCDSNTLFNVGDEIIKYIGKYNKFTFPNCDYGRFKVLTNNHAPGGALYAFSPNTSSIYIIGKSYLLDTQTNRLAFGETSLPDDAIAVYSSDDLMECRSFLSWLKTKFVRFFVAVNISKLAPMMCNECFKLVPAPPSGKFDHIYTDEELYKAFNLPQKYIDVIESIIKKRK